MDLWNVILPISLAILAFGGVVGVVAGGYFLMKTALAGLRRPEPAAERQRSPQPGLREV